MRVATDLLDSDVEAFALMADGCRMVRTKYAEGLKGFQTSGEQHFWQFLEFDSMLTSPVPVEASKSATAMCKRRETVASHKVAAE